MFMMQNSTTSPSNVTKSKEQILIQSSGAMIAVIVIGVIVILTILLFILKTYNKRTHASRLLGSIGGSKPHKKTSQSTAPIVPMATIGVSSLSGGVPDPSPGPSEGRRAGWNSEDFSTASGLTAVTIHDTSGNT
ncbi:noncompact myelin-associated protein [Syngnathoides biaculeatus]|uniref:noncompact myelin-associated protein n=1 Tax=Syngnathoides biaculeatus TaxID=300417 RepID=UPI002ADDF7D9|nr:noncompact myelin-associated protein [Syngnathoides biaculeatus]XP_061699211.1 noncompact myelin-associated protein [Syngnathoides biaculeatus]